MCLNCQLNRAIEGHYCNMPMMLFHPVKFWQFTVSLYSIFCYFFSAFVSGNCFLWAGRLLFAHHRRTKTPISISPGWVLPIKFSLFILILVQWLITDIVFVILFSVLIAGHMLGVGGIWNRRWKIFCFLYHWKAMWCGRGTFNWWHCQGDIGPNLFSHLLIWSCCYILL